MAVGFDMESAKAVLEIKEKYGLALVACLPCAEQSANFSEKIKSFIAKILSRCDENGSAGTLLRRRLYVQTRQIPRRKQRRVSVLLRRNSGGTYYTVNYAKKNEIKK